jgi:hypothetical protein
VVENDARGEGEEKLGEKKLSPAGSWSGNMLGENRGE